MEQIGIMSPSPEAVFGVLSALLVLLSFAAAVWKSRHQPRGRKHGAASLPPEVPGRRPIVGHLHKLADARRPLARILGALAEKHGPLITLRIGVHRVVVVSSAEMVAECFTGTNDKSIASRPKSTAAAHMTYNYAILGFAPYGAYWRHIRKIASLQLLSQPKLELLKHVRAKEVDLAVKGLYDQKERPVKVEMKRWFVDLTFNNVVMTVVGKRYHGSGALNHDDAAEARRFQRAIHDFFAQTGSFVPADAIPILGWLDVGGYVRAMKRTFRELDSFCCSWLEERRRLRRRHSADVYGPDRDFLDVMLRVSEELEFPDYDRDTVIKATCLTMIIAGTDSTSITLTWALSLLLNNPHTLQKVQEELDAQVGKDRKVTESDISNLPYLRAVVKETLRLHPPAPVIPYEATEDYCVGGYMIPAGTQVLVNMWNIHRNPTTWSDPVKFLPERFLTGTNAGVDMRGQHFDLIPFGTGRRVCPGISFGLQILHLTLARLLHGFDVKTPFRDQLVDMTEEAGFSNPKATPLDVLLCPRLSENHYHDP